MEMWLEGTSPDMTPAQRAAELGVSLSVLTAERYMETEHQDEAAANLLRRAADHIYRQQDNGNPDNYRAVDLMDAMRERLWPTD